MFKNDLGHEIPEGVAIFPIMYLNECRGIMKSLGSGFFINETGWFITAKHVLLNNSGKSLQPLFGVQINLEGGHFLRQVTHLTDHSVADIAIGKLGESKDLSGNIIPTKANQFLMISFKRLFLNDRVHSFGYPQYRKGARGELRSLPFQTFLGKRDHTKI